MFNWLLKIGITFLIVFQSSFTFAQNINPAIELIEDAHAKGYETTVNIMAISKSFELSNKEAKVILSEMRSIVSTWKSIAQNLGMNARDVDQYAPAFEYHEP